MEKEVALILIFFLFRCSNVKKISFDKANEMMKEHKTSFIHPHAHYYIYKGSILVYKDSLTESELDTLKIRINRQLKISQ